MLINKLLNIKYPLFQGAMANISDGKFAASVSNSGALGIIASGSLNAEQIREQIKICKELTDKPFGVNLMLMNPDIARIVDVVCEEKVSIVTTGAGNPGPYIPKLKENNVKVFPIVASSALARRLLRYDIDGLIAEGGESGGHVGETTTMSLVPQIVKLTDKPVIAAGGIASGKQFNAALALGAKGVQVATMLLVADETPIHENYKQVVLNASDIATTVTGRSLGAPVRIYKNAMSQTYLELERNCASREELEMHTLGGLRKAINGDVINGSVMMGQVAGLVKERGSVKYLIEKLLEDAKNEKAELEAKLNELE